MKLQKLKRFTIVFTLLFYSCFSNIEVPITFTQTQTAAERQMIGNDKQLEKNGWLISSIKTSSSGLQDWKKESSESLGIEEDSEEFLLILRSLAYIAPEIQRFKNIGILGEGLDGTLQKNPLYTPPSEEEKANISSNRVKEVVQLTNEYRKKIYEKRIEVETKKKSMNPVELDRLKKDLKLVYYRGVSTGEFYEKEKGKWIRKE